MMANTTSYHYLKIMTANVNSIRKRLTELNYMINEHKPDVICLQETKMKKKLKIAGYKDVHSTPPGENNSGARGSKILVAEKINSEKIDMQALLTKGLELTSAELYLSGQPTVRIVNMYVSPSVQKPEKQKDILNKLKTASKSAPLTVVTGDGNAKLDIPLHESTNRFGDLLDEERINGEIVALVPDEYTRYDPAGRNPSVLDIALVQPQHSNIVSKMQVLDSIGSDHRPVLMTLRVAVPKQTRVTEMSNLDKADWRAHRSVMDMKLDSAPAEIEPNKQSIDTAIDYFTEAMQETDRETIPRLVIKESDEETLPPYIVDKIKVKRQLSNRLHKKKETNLKPVVNRLGKEIKREKIEYLESKKVRTWEECNDKSPHGFYRLAKKYLNPRAAATTYPLKDENGIHLKTDEEKIEVFENLYSEIFTPPPSTDDSAETDREAQQIYDEIQDLFQEVKPRGEGHDLKLEVTPEMIIKSLKQAKNTAPGIDGIHYKHVRNLSVKALTYLAKIYNACSRCCYFPDKWKLGITTLQSKPGKDPSNPTSYRPITLLPVLGKIYERLINQELKRYLEDNNLLPESQAGFRERRSTQDKLLQLIEEAQNNSKKGMVTLATFFDIEKAFDKMCHEGVTLKMKRLGFSVQTIALIVNYLTNRSVRIRLNGKYSNDIQLKAGTPQGAILSPTIFSIWVGDIPQPKEKCTRVSQFADDMSSWSTARSCVNVRDRLQTYNNELTKWCRQWKILLSPRKTQMIAFYNKRPQNAACLTQNINGNVIKCSEEVTFLGVILDPKLQMRKHHQKLIKSAKRKTRLFAGITGTQSKPRASSDLCEKILKSMIVPTFYYAPTATCIRKDNLFKQQDDIILRAGRLAIHAPKTTAGRYVKEQLNLDSSKDRTVKLAKDYVMNPERSPTVRKLIDEHYLKTTVSRRIKSPLDVILGQSQ